MLRDVRLTFFIVILTPIERIIKIALVIQCSNYFETNKTHGIITSFLYSFTIVLCSEYKTQNIEYCRRFSTVVNVILWTPILFVSDFSSVSSNKLYGYSEPIGIMIYIGQSCRPRLPNTRRYVRLLIFTHHKQQRNRSCSTPLDPPRSALSPYYPTQNSKLYYRLMRLLSANIRCTSVSNTRVVHIIYEFNMIAPRYGN